MKAGKNLKKCSMDYSTSQEMADGSIKECSNIGCTNPTRDGKCAICRVEKRILESINREKVK